MEDLLSILVMKLYHAGNKYNFWGAFSAETNIEKTAKAMAEYMYWSGIRDMFEPEVPHGKQISK